MSKSKWGKTILGLAAVGGAVAAGAIYLTKKNKCEECNGFDDDFEDDDFDLDSDLKPVEREYVSLTPSAEAEEAVEECCCECNEECCCESDEECTEECCCECSDECCCEAEEKTEE